MDFVAAKARAATHPIFGKVVNENKVKQVNGISSRKTLRGGGFSTQGTPPPPKTSKEKLKCPSCSSSHWLSRCQKFRKQSLQEGQVFVDDNKLYSNCLTPGHFVRDCPKESFCGVQGCIGKHATFLNPRSNANASTASTMAERSIGGQGKGVEPPPVNSNATNNGYIKSNYSTSSHSVTRLAILPVWVKAKGHGKTVETYAFLDSGSNTSFCTEGLLEKLKCKGTKTKLSLTTLQGENEPIECSLVSLEACDLSKDNTVQLPRVYSRPTLPIPRSYCSTRRC